LKYNICEPEVYMSKISAWVPCLVDGDTSLNQKRDSRSGQQKHLLQLQWHTPNPPSS